MTNDITQATRGRTTAAPTDRTTARRVGALFITATVAGILSVALQSPHTSADDPVNALARHQNTIATSALLELVMALALAAIPIVLFPVLRRTSERLAIGYVVSRAVEGLIISLDVVALLTLTSLGTGAAGENNAGDLGGLVISARDWLGHGVLDIVVFPIGALMLNYVLFRARLVPRWLSTWGLVGAGLYLAAGILVLFGLEPMGPAHILLAAPLALEEMVFAVWLLVRGFNTALPESTATPTRTP